MLRQRACGEVEAVTKRSEIVEAARGVLGVRWTHQGRDAKHGLDCIGLVLHALQVSGWQPRDPDTALFNRYGRFADDDAITAALEVEAARVELDEVQPADLLLIHSEGFQFPQHLAIVSEVGQGNIYIIHAFGQYPRCVVEHRLDAQARQSVVSAWHLHNVA